MSTPLPIYSIARPGEPGKISVWSYSPPDAGALDFWYEWHIIDDAGEMVASSHQRYRCAAITLRDGINADLGES